MVMISQLTKQASSEAIKSNKTRRVRLYLISLHRILVAKSLAKIIDTEIRKPN